MRRLWWLVLLLGCASPNEPISPEFDFTAYPLFKEVRRTQDVVVRRGYVLGDIFNLTDKDVRVEVVCKMYFLYDDYISDRPSLILTGETGLIASAGHLEYRIIEPTNELRSGGMVQYIVTIPEFSLHPLYEAYFWRLHIKTIGATGKIWEGRYDQSIQKR